MTTTINFPVPIFLKYELQDTLSACSQRLRIRQMETHNEVLIEICGDRDECYTEKSRIVKWSWKRQKDEKKKTKKEKKEKKHGLR